MSCNVELACMASGLNTLAMDDCVAKCSSAASAAESVTVDAVGGSAKAVDFGSLNAVKGFEQDPFGNPSFLNATETTKVTMSEVRAANGTRTRREQARACAPAGRAAAEGRATLPRLAHAHVLVRPLAARRARRDERGRLEDVAPPRASGELTISCNLVADVGYARRASRKSGRGRA